VKSKAEKRYLAAVKAYDKGNNALAKLELKMMRAEEALGHFEEREIEKANERDARDELKRASAR
jgi:hypothetical protein